jgi:hypothetical protein
LYYNNNSFGVVGLQTNNILFLTDNTFADVEQVKLEKAKFIAKERELLTVNIPLKFNGGIIRLLPDGNRITLTQEQQYKNVKPITTKLATSTGSQGATKTLTPKD